MHGVRKLPLVVLALALLAPACGGDDDDDAESLDDAAAQLSDAAEAGDPDAIAEAASDVVDEGLSELAGDDGSSTDGVEVEVSADCADLAPAIEIVGLNWSYLQAIATSGDPALFDDIAPGGVLPVDFAALHDGIDDLRALEDTDPDVAAALDRLAETADLAQEGIDADEEGRLEVAADLAELTDGGALIVTDQVTLGTALAEAGC